MSEIILHAVHYGTTTITVNADDYAAAVRAGEVDFLLDTVVSDMADEIAVIDTAGRTVAPYQPYTDMPVYRAARDGIPLGLYLAESAARAHCEADIRDLVLTERPEWAAEEDAEEAVLDTTPVGGYRHTVTRLTVAAGYDPEADA